jgi:hypothetical protein
VDSGRPRSIKLVILRRASRSFADSDVFDGLEWLARNGHRTASKAVIACLRESPSMMAAMAEVQRDECESGSGGKQRHLAKAGRPAKEDA